jgi:hypothetical protein
MVRCVDFVMQSAGARLVVRSCVVGMAEPGKRRRRNKKERKRTNGLNRLPCADDGEFTELHELEAPKAVWESRCNFETDWLAGVSNDAGRIVRQKARGPCFSATQPDNPRLGKPSESGL